ncbi:hypothetical protein AgCh_007267 [Apium graveolens]
MKESENLDDFYIKLHGIVTNIRALGETMEEGYMVKKLLRAVPTKFLQIASAIEQFGKIEEMSMEEVVGSLKDHEERLRGTSETSQGQLLMTEEEWRKKESHEGQLLLTREEWLKRSSNREGSGNPKQLEILWALELMTNEGMVYGLPRLTQPSKKCEGCLMAKHSRNSFPAHTKFEAPQSLEIIYADICGPISPTTHEKTIEEEVAFPEQFSIFGNGLGEDSGSSTGNERKTPIAGENMFEYSAGRIVETPESEPKKFRSLDELYNETEVIEMLDELKLLKVEEPTSYGEAAKETEWQKAMNVEFDMIEKNQTWVLTDLPSGVKPIGLKWVYKLKKDAEGNIVKHKARLVANGYVQKKGIDYNEVFAPVARLETIRLLLALSAKENWEVHHLDVKSAFLNDKLIEEVQESVLIVGVYVDDLLVVGSDKEEINKFKVQMSKRFEMSDLGLLSYYLGIEVQQGKMGITLKQSAHVKKILEKAGMQSLGVVSKFMERPTVKHQQAVKHILRYISGTVEHGLRYSGDGNKKMLAGFTDSDLVGDVVDRRSTSGELILEKAKETMKILYPQQDQEHTFSQGWLEKFKLRHGIKSFRRFGESGSVDVQDMEKKLESIREKINQFPMKDVFNMDETGLFYRLQADHSLATKQLEGRKQDKERLTVVICCNEDGSEKIPLWIIGKYAKPRCFKNVNMGSLNCYYRANKRAWMTSVLFDEYIRWRFYRGLLEGYELGQSDPGKINVLDAINYAVATWTTNVKQESIARCFQHCKIRSIDEVSSNLNEHTTPEEYIHELEVMIKDLGYRNKMDVNNFLDYPGENESCSEVQSIEEIANTILENSVEDDLEDDTTPLEPVTRKEALKASKMLNNFLMQHESTTPELLDAIRKIRDEFHVDLNYMKKQTTIESYFTKM